MEEIVRRYFYQDIMTVGIAVIFFLSRCKSVSLYHDHCTIALLFGFLTFWVSANNKLFASRRLCLMSHDGSNLSPRLNRELVFRPFTKIDIKFLNASSARICESIGHSLRA